MSSLKCPKSKLLSHCLTELFPIYQNKHWAIRLQDNSSVDTLSHRIILKIVGFLMYHSILNTTFKYVIDIDFHLQPKSVGSFVF